MNVVIGRREPTAACSCSQHNNHNNNHHQLHTFHHSVHFGPTHQRRKGTQKIPPESNLFFSWGFFFLRVAARNGAQFKFGWRSKKAKRAPLFTSIAISSVVGSVTTGTLWILMKRPEITLFRGRLQLTFCARPRFFASFQRHLLGRVVKIEWSGFFLFFSLFCLLDDRCAYDDRTRRMK